MNRPAFTNPNDALRYYVSGPGGAHKEAITIDSIAAAHAKAAAQPAPMTGQQAYEADCLATPTYHDGAPRKAWADLCPAFRDNWNRHAGAGA